MVLVFLAQLNAVRELLVLKQNIIKILILINANNNARME